MRQWHVHDVCIIDMIQEHDNTILNCCLVGHGMQHGKTTVIFFLGGCTFTEVSAIRFLAQHDESKFFFVCL